MDMASEEGMNDMMSTNNTDKQIIQEESLELRQGIVVAGEASESDEEDATPSASPDSSFSPQNGPAASLVSSIPPLKVNHQERGDPLSDAEDSPTHPLLKPDAESPSQETPPKYDTLLHRKLRDRNVAFRKHLCATFGQLYLSAAKDINTTTSQLIKSHAAILETSNSMRYMTNDLFQLEDKINIIANCNILPEIHMR